MKDKRYLITTLLIIFVVLIADAHIGLAMAGTALAVIVSPK